MDDLIAYILGCFFFVSGTIHGLSQMLKSCQRDKSNLIPEIGCLNNEDI